ncbi:MAG TPA: 4Fe-4S binding protein [Candidatus Limnocylindrales bacterium]|jgi:ferredoxin|nr:4Fe-4S binding protein [Candidatus Limnocylindrales bacterium]
MFRFFRRKPEPAAIIPVPAAAAPVVLSSVMKVSVDQDVCHHCGACVAVCPPDAIFLDSMFLRINQDTCTACERCVKMCPVHALAMVTPKETRHARLS